MPVTEAALNQLRDRLEAVERKQAVREETLRNIETRLAAIESTLSRLTWLMVTAIGGAAMAFVVNGGFHVLGH